MRKMTDILKRLAKFFFNIEEKLIDEFEGYDTEQNMED